MRCRLASLSALGSKHLKVSNKLKCSQAIARRRYSLVVDEDVKKPTNQSNKQTNKSQTIAMDKPQQVHCVCLTVCQKVLQRDKNCTYTP